MDVTRERISRILELREILLSIQTGFSLVNAAVACAILERISGLEPSSAITEPRYLKLVTVSSFCPFTFMSVLMPLVLLSSDWSYQHWSPCRRLWRLCRHTTNFARFSSPAKSLMSSAKQKLVIVLPLMLTVGDFVIFLDVCHDRFQKYVKECEWE